MLKNIPKELFKDGLKIVIEYLPLKGVKLEFQPLVSSINLGNTNIQWSTDDYYARNGTIAHYKNTLETKTINFKIYAVNEEEVMENYGKIQIMKNIFMYGVYHVVEKKHTILGAPPIVKVKFVNIMTEHPTLTGFYTYIKSFSPTFKETDFVKTEIDGVTHLIPVSYDINLGSLNVIYTKMTGWHETNDGYVNHLG